MEIIRSTSYGFRTVIRVCHNHKDPLYVHSDGSSHPPLMVDGCSPPEGAAWVCVYSHREEEFIFDGDAQYRDGILLTSDELWEEVCGRCELPSAPLEIEGLVGRSS